VTTNGFFTIDELSAVLRATLASFDGTTNAPVIYPLGRSLEELERQLVMQVVPSVLPPATSGVPYSAKLNGVGGNPPYIWTLAPNSPALPLGLTLASDGSGVISGTPRQDGTFDFVVQMTDTTGITAGWQVTIVVY
jgi:hypothetical protein